MAFHHIERTTTTAPRDLTRGGQHRTIVRNGIEFDVPGAEPSVGGTVVTEHDIYRCGHCRALAVTLPDHGPPDTCGKCHNR